MLMLLQVVDVFRQDCDVFDLSTLLPVTTLLTRHRRKGRRRSRVTRRRQEADESVALVVAVVVAQALLLTQQELVGGQRRRKLEQLRAGLRSLVPLPRKTSLVWRAQFSATKIRIFEDVVIFLINKIRVVMGLLSSAS